MSKSNEFIRVLSELRGGRVQLGVKIVDRVWLEDQAIHEAKAALIEKTALNVYVGATK